MPRRGQWPCAGTTVSGGCLDIGPHRTFKRCAEPLFTVLSVSPCRHDPLQPPRQKAKDARRSKFRFTLHVMFAFVVRPCVSNARTDKRRGISSSSDLPSRMPVRVRPSMWNLPRLAINRNIHMSLVVRVGYQTRCRIIGKREESLGRAGGSFLFKDKFHQTHESQLLCLLIVFRRCAVSLRILVHHKTRQMSVVFGARGAGSPTFIETGASMRICGAYLALLAQCIPAL